MQKKRIWRLPTIELEQQLSVAQEMGVARPLAQVLLNRGLSSPEQVREFIEAGIENLRDPLDIPGMLIGAERIIKALDQNEHILIYGDYDVDGITATTLLTSFLRGLGGQVSYYIPDRRDEGYGLNVQALEQAQAKGAKLVVTVDCGISAKEEAQAAVQLGLDLVITDHHQVPQELPEAIAVIDPKIVAEEQPWTDLAGVGVAYKLAQAVKKLLGEDYYLEEYLDLVALGTVADIVPLRKENRILVKAGLAQISQTKRPGLQALLNVSGIGQEQVTVGQIGYAVAPRLNACGRLSQAEIGVELLLTEDEKRAQEIAQLLDQENRSRQDLESAIYTEALALVEKDVDISQDKVIILAAKDWHPGVIGIVASRLVEKFYRPTILISLEEGVGKGSGRSIHGFDLYQALQNVQEYLLSFGGHKMAAGLSIAEDQLPAFKSALKAYTEEVLTEKDLVPFIEVDCEILPEEINAELLEGIDKLAPFGFHNPAPVFALRNRSITNCSQVGKNNKHLRLRVQKEENSWLDGIAFQAGSLKEEACTWERCDLAFSPEINNWQGRSQIQLVIKDLKSATQPDDPTKPLSFLDELYQEGEIWLEDDYYRDIGEKEEFFTKLVGVTFENRQQLLREIPDGDSLEIIREYDNIHDKYAIKVCWQKQHIGYLNVKLARRLAPLMDKGVKYEAYLTLVTGRDKSTLGANICIQRKEEKLSPTDYNLRRQQLEQLDRSELRETIRQAILGKYDYHEKQLEAINALEAGQSSLVILATGRGKSAIFQTVAAELAITKKMMTLIVYPLRSLVNDQYRQLQSKLEPLGIDVQAVNGSMSVSEKKEFMKRLLQGQGDIILTTPEFLEFHLDKFKTIAPKIGLFVVDESHHLAQAKRRGYRSLAKSWRQLGKPLALATTATANNDTAKAIIQSLECQKIIVEEYIRTNLKLLDRRDEKDKLAYLLKLIARDEKTVIYVNSRKQAYQLAGELRSYYPQGKDQIAFYHGGLSSEQRLTLEDMYRQGELKVMVTTSAFGEGINIDDIKHVVLYHLCFSATEFNQLSGRAGRNRQEAFVHLLFGRRDRQLNEFILASVTPPREVMGIVYIFLRDQAAKNNPLNLTNAEITEAMQKKGLKNFREQTASTCLAIFEELGLLLREVTGNKRYIHFCPPPPGKMNLTDSIRYQEGLNEEEEFREFADNILVAGEEEIMAAFNKPIIPQGKGAVSDGGEFMLFEQLIEQVKKYQNNKEQLKFLEEAYQLAAKAHEGQTRISGDPYISHPLSVALILAQLELDIPTLAAALLHDVVEDTQTGLEVLKKSFGEEIAYLVDGVTKLSKIDFRTKEEQQAENLRKMFLAMGKDIRVILIKLADRLHNMRTLSHQPIHKQKEIAKETMEIYAPLANRLGIFAFKWELEDLSFRYLKPEEYHSLAERISMKRQERVSFIDKVIGILKNSLDEIGIKAEIQGRPKHFYSIYRKMVTKGKDLNEIYDLIAVRVIVNNVKDCYGALGIIHTLWKPMPGRFKDFIAMPKPNMYQSLHTTVMGALGEPFEIQIRTVEMHRTAELGIAAHWKYKEGSKAGGKDFDKRLAWLRQVLDWQTEVRDTKEFMDILKIDVFSDVVFVFTPKGDVIQLPAGSVPLDFAYRIHSGVGNRCIGAKVNGRIVPLEYVLKNGDIVEILTSKQTNGPSRDWLNIVKTSQAKSRIRHWFRKEKREENIALGKELLERELKRLGLEVSEFFKTEHLQDTTKRYAMSHPDDLMASVGEGTLNPANVVARVKNDIYKGKTKKEADVSVNEFILPEKKQSVVSKSQQGITVKGVDDVMVKLSHCCNPLPGDQIIGYVTRGRGVSIHRRDCPNAIYHMREEAGRIVEVEWDEGSDYTYQVEIEILALDRARLATDVMNAIADMKIAINSVHARSIKQGKAVLNLKLEIKSLPQLNLVFDKLKRIKDIIDVNRVKPKD